MRLRLGRAFRFLGLGALGLVALLALAYVLRVPLFGGLVKDAITSRLAEALGGRWEIESVGGNWITEIRVEGLHAVEAPAHGLLTGLRADETTVTYDLPGLLRDDPLAALEGIVMKGGGIDLDLTRPVEGGKGGVEPTLGVFEGFCGRVDVETDIVAETDSGPIRLEALRVVFAPGRDLDLSVRDVSLPDCFEVRGPLAGRVEEVGAGIWHWSSDAVLGEVRVRDATLDTRDGRVEARVEIAGGRVDVTLADGTVAAKAEGVDLARLPRWLVALAGDDVPLPEAGRLRADVVYRIRREPPGPLGGEVEPDTFDLWVRDVRWRDETVPYAHVKGSWAGGPTVDLSEVEIHGNRIRVQARRAALATDSPFLLHRVAILSADVESARAFLPDLERDFALSVEASSLEPRVLRVERLVVTSGDDRCDANGTVMLPGRPEEWRSTAVDLAIRGTLGDPAPLGPAWKGRVAVEGRVRGPLDALRVALDLTGEGVSIEGFGVDDARLEGTVRWPDVTVDALRIRAPGALLQVRGHASLDVPHLSEATGVLEVNDLAAAHGLLPGEAPELAGRLRVEGRVAFDGEALSGSAAVSGSGLLVEGTKIGEASGRVRSDGRRIVIEALDAHGPWGRVVATAEADPIDRRARVDALRFDGDGIEAYLRTPLALTWADGEVRIDGVDLGLDGARVLADAVVWPREGRCELTRFAWNDGLTRLDLDRPLHVAWSGEVIDVPDLAVLVDGTTEVCATFVVDLGRETAEVRSSSVRGPFGDAVLDAPLHLTRYDGVITVRDLDATVLGVHIAGSGTVWADESRAAVTALRVSGGDIAACLNAPVAIGWGGEGVEASGLDIAAYGGRITGRAAWIGRPTADLEVEGVPLDRWVASLEGHVSARVRIDGESALVTAEVEDLAWQEWEGGLVLVARQDEAGPLRLEHLAIRGPGGRALEGRASLPFRFTTGGVERLAGVEGTFALEGTLGGLGRLTHLAKGPIQVRAHGDASGLDLDLCIADLMLCVREQPCDDACVAIRVTADEITARVALANDEFAQVRGGFRLDRGFDWTRPEALGALVDTAAVDGRFTAVVRSWKPLAGVVPAIRRLEGAAGASLVVQGPLRSPEIEGTLTLSGVSLEMDSDVAPFEAVDARFVWKDDIIRIEKLEGEMGYAPFRIGGSMRVGHDGLPVVDLTVHGRNTQLLRTDWVRMRIDIDGRVTGPVDRLHLAGKGRIVDSVFREPMTLSSAARAQDTPDVVLFEITDHPFSQMTFDLEVEADNSIRICNNLLCLNGSFEGTLGGTGARPGFEGRFWFHNADIYLPLTTLRGSDGEIEFLPGSPGRPRIQMTAHTRTKGYEMGVQIAGRLPDVNLNVFTEPPLPEEDALLMLTTGSTAAELAEGGIIGKALAGVLSVFGGSLFTTRGEGDPGQVAFFERFDITADLSGTQIRSIDGELEIDRRFYLHVQQDPYGDTNVGLIWRLRFR